MVAYPLALVVVPQLVPVAECQRVQAVGRRLVLVAVCRPVQEVDCPPAPAEVFQLARVAVSPLDLVAVYRQALEAACPQGHSLI